jgi:hypothetical protein
MFYFKNSGYYEKKDVLRTTGRERGTERGGESDEERERERGEREMSYHGNRKPIFLCSNSPFFIQKNHIQLSHNILFLAV